MVVMALRLIRSAGFTNERNEFYNLVIKFSVFVRSLDKVENIVIIFVTGRFMYTLGVPFMTLTFIALLVITPSELGDKGLFDGDGFRLMEI